MLANPSTGADGDLFVSNLVNRPFFVVNGMRDPLYPAARVAPYLEALETAGVSLTFHPQATGGHDTSWWESERPAYEAFVHDHPRPAHPPLLSWTTERTDRYNRIQWLVIDELGVRGSDAALADINTIAERYDADFGVRGDSRKEQGTRIVQVIPETDAATMGLPVGDKILEIDGRPIAALPDILAAFERNAGPSITFVVDRGGERLDAEGPVSAGGAARSGAPAVRAARPVGAGGRGAPRQHLRGAHPRRRPLHAAAVARRRRLRQAGGRDRRTAQRGARRGGRHGTWRRC